MILCIIAASIGAINSVFALHDRNWHSLIGWVGFTILAVEITNHVP